MQKRKATKKILHVLVCLFFLGFPLIFFTRQGSRAIEFALASPFYWINSLAFGLLFYFNLYYLAPRFYCQKHYLKYFGAVLLLLIGFHFLKPFDNLLKDYFRYFGMHVGQIEPYDPTRIDVFSNVFFFVVMSLSLAIRVIKRWQESEKRILQAEADKANAELSFLKNQINPHFLFNTLNNIYSLSVVQDPKTSLSIMKLSNLMRYIADDAIKDFISLEREAAYIRDFIDLQKLRLGQNMQVDFTVTGNTENKSIAPLILMSFVENTFKYGVTTREPATIAISLFSDEKKITFFCQNKILVQQHRVESTGIGLANTRHRLNMIYPGRHTLEIDDSNGLFTVNLTLFA